MAIGTPQSLGSNSSSGTSPIVLTTGANILAGDLVIVAVVYETSSNPVVSVSDGTNTYARLSAAYIGGVAELWYKANCQAVGSGASITATLGGGSIADVLIGAVRCAGLSAAPFDKGAIAANGSITVTSPTLTFASELAVAFLGGYNMTSITEDAAFTSLISVQFASDQVWINLAYKIVSSTTAIVYNPSATGAHNNVAAQIVTFAPPQTQPYTLRQKRNYLRR